MLQDVGPIGEHGAAEAQTGAMQDGRSPRRLLSLAGAPRTAVHRAMEWTFFFCARVDRVVL